MASSLSRWLAGLDADRLAEILVRRPDVATPSPRDLSTLARRLRRRDSVTLAFYDLPLPAVQMVELARSLGGPTVSLDQLARALNRTIDDSDLHATLRLLTQHALVWPDPDFGTLHMAGPLWPIRPYPLRLGPPPPGNSGVPGDPHWQPRFDPHPPPPALVAAEPAAVDRETAAAATSAVARVAALLADCSATPVATLRGGGVGVRELRRLARAVGCDEREARLSLELAHAAGLVAVVCGQVLPTEAYDHWRAGEPACQLVTLLRAWSELPAAPLTPGVTDGAPQPAALSYDPAGPFAQHLRPRVLQVAAGLPEGQGIADAKFVEDILVWQSPMLVGAMPAKSELVAGLWQEACLLALVAHGTLSPLGRAVLHEADDHSLRHDCPADLEQVTQRLLPAAVRTAMFQADLTAVVPGAPASDLAELLDAVADRESRGGAAVWRFRPASVRRALDTGQDAETLLRRLREFAANGALPQPLEYLVGDVARRHGSIRVRAAKCVLHTQDPALTTEIAAVRSLSTLGLTMIAPTVLVSGKPVAEVLAALRSAGYAPVGESAHGVARVEPVRSHRAPAQRRRPPAVVGLSHSFARGSPQPTAPSSVDALALAVRLLATRTNDPGDTYCAEAADSLPSPEGLNSLEGLAGTEGLEGIEGLAGLDGLDGLDWCGFFAGLRPDPVEYADASYESAGAPTSPATVTPAEVDELVANVVRYASHLTAPELEHLAAAVAFCTPIKIRYTNASGAASVRVIEPIGLSGSGLVARCRLRDDERVFVLGRIAAVAPV